MTELPMPAGRTRWAADGGHDVAPLVVTARIARRTPTVLPAPRWTALAMAAALILTALDLIENPLRLVASLRRYPRLEGARQ